MSDDEKAATPEMETILFFGNYGHELFGVLVATKGEHKIYKKWWHGWNPTVSVRLATPDDAPAIHAFMDKARAAAGAKT